MTGGSGVSFVYAVWAGAVKPAPFDFMVICDSWETAKAWAEAEFRRERPKVKQQLVWSEPITDYRGIRLIEAGYEQRQRDRFRYRIYSYHFCIVEEPVIGPAIDGSEGAA
jgi:hypothetical protein